MYQILHTEFNQFVDRYNTELNNIQTTINMIIVNLFDPELCTDNLSPAEISSSNSLLIQISDTK